MIKIAKLCLRFFKVVQKKLWPLFFWTRCITLASEGDDGGSGICYMRYIRERGMCVMMMLL